MKFKLTALAQELSEWGIPLQPLQAQAHCSRGHSWKAIIDAAQGIVKHRICQQCYNEGYYRQTISIIIGE